MDTINNIFGNNCSDQQKCGSDYFCRHVDNSGLDPIKCVPVNCPICFVSSSFEHNAELYDQIVNQIDDHIWKIFIRYTSELKINFNSPDTWRIDLPDIIHFEGNDGCMGCYDHMSLNIPMKFFTNPDEAFKEYQNILRIEKESEEARKRIHKLANLKETEKKERDLYESLKKKYGSKE